MNVRTGGDITQALAFARKNQPAMVFFEDIDSVTAGDRTESVNIILNEIDGFLSKDAEVIVILTTNNLGVINRAMLRPGRIDSMIELGELDKNTVADFVRTFAGHELSGDLDDEALWEASKGYVPAFIVRAVQLAKSYALARSDDAIIACDDIVAAMRGLRPQFELMMGEQTKSRPDLDTAFSSTVRDAVHLELTNGDSEEFAERIAEKVADRM